MLQTRQGEQPEYPVSVSKSVKTLWKDSHLSLTDAFSKKYTPFTPGHPCYHTFILSWVIKGVKYLIQLYDMPQTGRGYLHQEYTSPSKLTT